jgi:hypothetical protein
MESLVFFSQSKASKGMGIGLEMTSLVDPEAGFFFLENILLTLSVPFIDALLIDAGWLAVEYD